MIQVGIDRAFIGSFTLSRLPIPLSQGAWAAASRSLAEHARTRSGRRREDYRQYGWATLMISTHVLQTLLIVFVLAPMQSMGTLFLLYFRPWLRYLALVVPSCGKRAKASLMKRIIFAVV